MDDPFGDADSKIGGGNPGAVGCNGGKCVVPTEPMDGKKNGCRLAAAVAAAVAASLAASIERW